MSKGSESLLTYAAELALEQLGLTLERGELERLVYSAALYVGTRALLADPEALTGGSVLASTHNPDRNALTLRLLIAFFEPQVGEDIKSVEKAGRRMLYDAIRLRPDQIDTLIQVMRANQNSEREHGTASSAADVAHILNRAGLDLFFEDKPAVVYQIGAQRLLLNTAVAIGQRQLEPLIQPMDTLIQQTVRVLFDKSRYEMAAIAYDKLELPVLADTARLLGIAAQLVEEGASSGRINRDMVGKLEQVLHAHRAHSADDLKAYSWLYTFSLSLRVMLQNLIACHPSVDHPVRVRSLVQAQADSREAGIHAGTLPAPMRGIAPAVALLGPSLKWQQALLETGMTREKLQAEAIDWLNVLIARSSLEESAAIRTSQMTALTLMLAGWKFERGDFAAALDTAAVAGALGQGFREAIHNEIEPMLKDLEELEDADYGELPKPSSLKLLLSATLEAADLPAHLADIIVSISSAKLAERRNDFDIAAEAYWKAQVAESSVTSGLRGLIKEIVGASDNHTVGEASTHQAKAAYFGAMGSLNRGDRELLAQHFDLAREHYAEAKERLGAAEEIWAILIPNSPEVGGYHSWNALREASICRLRATYCDARIDMATAEQYSRLKVSLVASERFLASKNSFNKILECSIGIDTDRNLQLLRAAAAFCEGRHLLEVEINEGTADNLAQAIKALDTAAEIYSSQQEHWWSKYIRALAATGTVIVAQKALSAQPNQVGLASLVELKAAEAVNIFNDLGLPERAEEARGLLNGVAGVLACFAPPKPAELPTTRHDRDRENILSKNISQRVEETADSKISVLRKLRSIGLSNDAELADTIEWHKSGRIDEGRFLALVSGMYQKRAEILLEVRQLVGGADPDFDGAVDEALNAIRGESTDDIAELLSLIAARYGLGQRFVTRLTERHSGLTYSFIEAGLAIAEQAMSQPRA